MDIIKTIGTSIGAVFIVVGIISIITINVSENKIENKDIGCPFFLEWLYPEHSHK